MDGAAPSIVVLTGSGISAESGLDTFRERGGIWSRYDMEDVATPRAFARNPDLVHRFYNERRRQLLSPAIAPNPAHTALAALERRIGRRLLLVTQNIDDLHERAGSASPHHMHGELRKARCLRSGEVVPWDGDLSVEDRCSCCGAAGLLRPHVVWFGEIPLGLDRIHRALAACDLFVAIGTSGTVYPAAGFVSIARQNRRARTLEINLEPTALSPLFDEHIDGPAGDAVPRWLSRAPEGI